MIYRIAAGAWLFGSDKGRETRDNVGEKIDSFLESCDSKSIVYDIDELREDLKANLTGQHIVNATLLPALRAHHRNLQRSEKPLVMSFHGTMGTGKNFVSDLIIKHVYRKGGKSKFVHKYMARKDFPLVAQVDNYRVSINAHFYLRIALFF